MYAYRLSAAVFAGHFFFPGLVLGQVVTDGTVGAGRVVTGPDYDIGADLGTQAGDNLFHSFEQFSIGTGESATFSGPGGIDNIISRVTGGDISAVDGLIASTIPGASLWLFNPAGVVFGPNASLDVSGSFHVSTADEVRFSDGGRFSAVDPNGNGFSVAAPESFGFLGSDPAGITIAGSQLAVGEGETLTVAGGDVDILGASLLSTGGALNVFAADGAADANVVTGDLTGDTGGDISVDNGSLLASIGDGGGIVRIEGGAFVVDGASTVASANVGAADGDIGIAIDVSSADIVGGSAVRSNARAGGRGGDVDLKAGRVRVAGNSSVESNSFDSGDGGNIVIASGELTIVDSLVAAQTVGTGANVGAGGDILVVADSIDIRTTESGDSSRLVTFSGNSADAGDLDVTGGRISLDGVTTIGSLPGTQAGRGGRVRLAAGSLDLLRGGTIIADSNNDNADRPNIDVTADRITIGEETDVETLSGIFLQVNDEGDAPGSIIVRADKLDLRNRGSIASITQGTGNAGNITILAGDISISGQNRGEGNISSRTVSGSSGDGGKITIVADNLALSGNTSISASTLGEGDAGVIDITTRDSLRLQDRSFISTVAGQSVLGGDVATGDAGSISIKAGNLTLLGATDINSSTSGTGSAGSIDITADVGLIDGENSEGFNGIATQASEGSSGDAGDITLAIDDLTLLNTAQITSSSFGSGSAGTVSIVSNQILIDTQQVQRRIITGITTSVDTNGNGDAGAITITADRLTLRGNAAQILSSNDGAGSAGTIDIRLADGLLLDDGGDIFTNSASAGGGGISISAGNFVASSGSGSIITTTVADDAGNAGDIFIGAPLLALGDSFITARADAGRGGDIQISVEDLILSPLAEINAEAGATGIDGTIVISSPEVDLTGGLAALDGRFLNVASLLRERCAARRAEEGSSFTLGTGGAIATNLDAPRPSLLRSPSHLRPMPGGGLKDRFDQRTALVLPCPKAMS